MYIFHLHLQTHRFRLSALSGQVFQVDPEHKFGREKINAHIYYTMSHKNLSTSKNMFFLAFKTRNFSQNIMLY